VKPQFKIICGDSLRQLDFIDEQSISMVFTSPDPGAYSFGSLISIFHKCKRVLGDAGSLWVHAGDSHDEDGNLMMIPERFAMRMIDDMWILRDKLIWYRPDHSPQTDPHRFKREWEYVYRFTKQRNEFFSHRYKYPSMISIPYTIPKRGVFDSGFPESLVRVAIDTTSLEGGWVLDPFCGTGVTGVAALKAKRNFIGIEIDEAKIVKIQKRLKKV
jgi:DNA modification methylase